MSKEQVERENTSPSKEIITEKSPYAAAIIDTILWGFMLIALVYQFYQINTLRSENEAMKEFVIKSVAASEDNRARINALIKAKKENSFMVMDTHNFLEMKDGAKQLEKAIKVSKSLSKNGVFVLMPELVYSYPENAQISKHISRITDKED